MLKEFKAFAMRGNVLDMAVGIIIGAAFGRIITSFVSDVIMPPIGLAAGQSRFFESLSEYFGDIVCNAGAGQGGGCGDDQLRRLPEHGSRFLDRGVGDFPAGPPSEPLEQARTGRGSHDEGMSLLCFSDSPEGHALPELHFRSAR